MDTCAKQLCRDIQVPIYVFTINNWLTRIYKCTKIKLNYSDQDVL